VAIEIDDLGTQGGGDGRWAASGSIGHFRNIISRRTQSYATKSKITQSTLGITRRPIRRTSPRLMTPKSPARFAMALGKGMAKQSRRKFSEGRIFSRLPVWWRGD
jgi:hypothetical protein